MGVFVQNLVYESTNYFYKGKRLYITVEPVSYSYTETMRIDVPAAFVTDLASIPRIGYLWLVPDGPYAAAAVVHDFLYRNKLYSRKQCDSIFMDAMIASNIPSMVRWTLFLAVRLFGAFAYGRNTYMSAYQPLQKV